MIISASRRTDIPAFYSDWFFNRLQEGHVLVRNPMRFHQVSKINLSPDDVDFIAFWSKNPAPLIPRLKEFDAYDYGFHFTLTGYGQRIEPGVPDTESLVGTFRALAEKVGPARIIWRYDPILVHRDWQEAEHRLQFRKMAASLAGSTHRCVISFLDIYQSGAVKLKSEGVSTVTPEIITSLAPYLAETAACYGMTLEACAEPHDLTGFGILPGHCIDAALTGMIPKGKDRNQRPHCGCQPSVDIGAYHCCAHRCVYCYANHGETRLASNLRLHRKDSPLLIGSLLPEDVVTVR